MRIIILFSLFLSLLFIQCKEDIKKETVDAMHSDLHLENGVLFLKDTPFSGVLVKQHQNNILASEINYDLGRKNGIEKQWYLNGDLAIERTYKKGIKIGKHTGWWQNKKRKFQYSFNAKGQYHGNTKEWYTNGALYKDFNYLNGKEDGKQRLWKPDGSIKANYEVVNGDRFGLIGLKRCNTNLTIN